MNSTKPLSDLALFCPIGDLALFLDFDGTLADIVDHPDDVQLPANSAEAIAKLHCRTAGAVAIVTGRPIAQIDSFLTPLVLPVAGVHGMARRTFDGTVHESGHDAALFATVQERLTRLHLCHPQTMVELKPGSVAFHYRRRPDLLATIADEIHASLGELEGLDILHGKMVVEVKTGHANKGSAIRAFMEEAPFHGRLPIFAGDDVTDEFGFQAMADLGGVAVKIGDGDTSAKWRAESPEAFRQWLVTLASAA